MNYYGYNFQRLVLPTVEYLTDFKLLNAPRATCFGALQEAIARAMNEGSNVDRREIKLIAAFLLN